MPPLLTFLLTLGTLFISPQTPDTTITNADGTRFVYRHFPSQFVEPRTVEVWVPSDYAAGDSDRFAVLYMHDGQNLFELKESAWGKIWEIDKTMARLLREKKIRKTIIVGIRSSRIREREFQPQAAYEMFTDSLQASFDQKYGGPPKSNEYLRFLTEEVKPFVDAHYRTLSDRANTFIMGSSRGGLISLYAIERYPQIFCGAGCVSTHWPVHTHVNIPTFGETMVRYFGSQLPDPNYVKIYFDYGTTTLDAWYEPYQTMMDSIMVRSGFTEGKNWITKRFPGEEHSELSWSKRAYVPLEFLLQP